MDKKQLLSGVAKLTGANSVSFKSVKELADNKELTCITKISSMDENGEWTNKMSPAAVVNYMSKQKKNAVVGAFTLDFGKIKLNLPVHKSTNAEGVASFKLNCRNLNAEEKAITNVERYGFGASTMAFSESIIPTFSNEAITLMYTHVNLFLDADASKDNATVNAANDPITNLID